MKAPRQIVDQICHMKNGILILWTLCLSCNGVNERKNQEMLSNPQSDSSNRFQKEEKIKIVDIMSKTLNLKNKIYDLFLKNDSINQEMIIKYETRNKINFILITSNKPTNQTDTLMGIATKDQDPRSDEYDQSEDGTAFQFDTWHYINEKCQIEFRIADSARFVRIFEFNCNRFHKLSCPFETGGVLEIAH